jgi:hypothetical protein
VIAVAVAALLAAVLLSTALVERAPALLRVRASASGRSETGR